MRRRRGQINRIVDAGLAAGLLAAVAIVFGVDALRGSKPSGPLETINELHVIENRTDAGGKSGKGRLIGVTPQVDRPGIQVFDDVGKLLKGLGKGYDHEAFDFNNLRSSEKIAKYSVIFITCSTFPDEWLGAPIGAGPRPGTQTRAINEEVFAEAAKALRDWVERGGTLYVSDLHFGLMAKTFENMIKAAGNDRGDVQTVNADVLDPGLRDQIGPKIELNFDQTNWMPAAFDVDKASVILRGEYTSTTGEKRTAPLLVKFAVGDGHVIFTSFHNEKVNNKNENKILEYLVFTAVTSRMQKQLQKDMKFAPQKSNLISASSEHPIATQKYQKEKPGRMQIALGFGDSEATLRLSVVAPNGKRYLNDFTSSVVLEIPEADAPKGDWEITVEAMKLPYSNFPFNVVIGQE